MIIASITIYFLQYNYEKATQLLTLKTINRYERQVRAALQIA